MDKLPNNDTTLSDGSSFNEGRAEKKVNKHPLPVGKMIIDSHAHVMREYFQDDQNEVIDRAFACNVCQFVNPGVTLEGIPELLELADKYQHLYIAVGLHPHEAKSWTDQSYGILKDAAKHQKVVAIGECGLDFHYNNSDEEAQYHALTEQIRLALELDKPLIVHCRDAWQKAFEILEREGKGELRGVFHCFTGGPELLARINELGFYVSFSGIVSFPNAKQVQAAAIEVISDRILVETDCPFLAPQKVRGARNEPSFVWYVAEKLAQLRNESVEDIASLCCTNARRLFNLPVLAPPAETAQ